MPNSLITAEDRTNAVSEVIKNLLILNSLQPANEKQSYSIFLDYKKDYDEYKFSIDIQKNYSRVADSLVSVSFKLEKLEEGLALLNKVRDSYILNAEILYTGFHQKENWEYPYDCYDAVGKHKIDFHYRIRSLEQCQALEEYDNALYQNPVTASKIYKKIIPYE